MGIIGRDIPDYSTLNGQEDSLLKRKIGRSQLTACKGLIVGSTNH
jgi:hypothetical protein